MWKRSMNVSIYNLYQDGYSNLKVKVQFDIIVLVSAFSKTENLKNKRIYFICPFSLYVTNILNIQMFLKSSVYTNMKNKWYLE